MPTIKVVKFSVFRDKMQTNGGEKSSQQMWRR